MMKARSSLVIAALAVLLVPTARAQDPGLEGKWTLAVEGGRRITKLLFDRPRECDAGEQDPWKQIDDALPCHARFWSPWLAAIGSFRSRDGQSGHPRYDVAADGSGFLMVAAENTAARELKVVLNWHEELKRLVPAN